MPPYQDRQPRRLNAAGRIILLGGAMTFASAQADSSYKAGQNAKVLAESSLSCFPPNDLSDYSPQLSNELLADIKRTIYEFLSPNNAFYLSVDNDGNLVRTDCPVVVPISLSAEAESIKIFTAPSISSRLTHEFENSASTRVVSNGVRVFGRTYRGKWGMIKLNGQVGGEWIMPTNTEAQPIHPTSGRLLNRGEIGYFVKANVVQLIPR